MVSQNSATWTGIDSDIWHRNFTSPYNGIIHKIWPVQAQYQDEVGWSWSSHYSHTHTHQWWGDKNFSETLYGPPSWTCYTIYVSGEWGVCYQLPYNFANFCPADMHLKNQQCADLINMTANSLSSGMITLMLMAVQKDNLKVSIHQAIEQWVVMYNELWVMIGCTSNTGQKMVMKEDLRILRQ